MGKFRLVVQLEKPKTSWEIEPTTFLLVTLCLKQLRYRAPYTRYQDCQYSQNRHDTSNKKTASSFKNSYANRELEIC
jgi:hypothetical protein